MLQAKPCPVTAPIRQRVAAPSAPAHGAGQRARAHLTPSACAQTFSTTFRPAAAPSRAQRARGRWSGGRSRTCGNHMESSQNRTQICRTQVQTGLELRNWGVYAPFLSTMVTFESMVTAARRIVLPHQLWEVQRDCLQSARLAYSNPPGSCSPPRQADDLCADHLRPQVVGAVRRPALASSRWMGRGRGTAHLLPARAAARRPSSRVGHLNDLFFACDFARLSLS